MRMLGLPDALRRFGLTVEVAPGWETRGNAAFNPGGTVGHHTAGSSRGTRPSLGIVVNGRPDLAGPLCNTYTDRNGVAVVVASGRANHAGPGGFRGLVGNSAVLGHEAEDEGDGQWTDAQRWAFPRVHAAHLWLLGRDASWYCSHRTWASPPGRKIDPAGLADVDIQRQIHALLTTNSPEDDMKDDERRWLERVHFELTNRWPNPDGLPAGDDTLVGHARWAHFDAYKGSAATQQAVARIGGLEGAVAALVAAHNGSGLTAEQITEAAKAGAAAALQERIDSSRVEITPKDPA